ncbi:hypothetical protein F2Q70_00002828 [Brassica cretica]|uniref:Uncharacterized protein n=1 Tax=Brassica cretica TaxID=69181 RepID=A0A8S9IVJ5_BRACR|nr:hypothetical protein F2Q70_00002828 [Brassica cretica]
MVREMEPSPFTRSVTAKEKKGETLGKIPKYLETSLKISAAGTGTRGVPRDREQPSRLFCVKITKLHYFLPLLFQLVHLQSNATPDLTRLHESSCSILVRVVPKAPRLLNLSFSSLANAADPIWG